MKCVIRSKAGYYARIKGKPRWIDQRKDAKVFRTKTLARGVIRLLKDNRIEAWVEEVRE